jgi:hypothetical protein
LACIHLRLSTDRQTALVEMQDENVKLPEPNQIWQFCSACNQPGVVTVQLVTGLETLCTR